MNADRRRMDCHMHFLRRAAQRGLVLTARDIVRIEDLADRSRPAFERPGIARHLLTIRQDSGRRLRVVYDVEFRCLVSVWDARGRRP